MIEEVNKEIAEIIKNIRPDSFLKLNEDDLESLREKSRSLPFNEKTKLIENYLVKGGTLLFDLAGVFEVVIRIDDSTSEDREKTPLAYLEFTDGVNSIVEVIDILESVKNNATNIGHPIIVAAIQHWEQLVRWAKYSKTETVYDINEEQKKDAKSAKEAVDAAKEVNYLLNIKLVEIANANLINISKAFLYGATKQQVPKETAFAKKVKNLRIGEKKTYLYVAWKRLAKEHITQSNEFKERVEKIEDFLKQIPSYQNNIVLEDSKTELRQYGSVESTISISVVIEFLKTDGKKFVYDEDNDKSLRPKWNVFRNAFINWYLDRTPETVKKYQKDAKKQKIFEVPYTPMYIGPLPQISLYKLLSDVFTSELVKVCSPIYCSKEKADSRSFSKLINQTDTK
jgi:hypothetical protein